MVGERGGARAGVALITPDRATGEALALACQGYGLTLTLADPMQGDVNIDSEVVVLDLLVDDPAIRARATAMVPGRTSHVLVLAVEPVLAVADLQVDGWITPDASVHEFVSAVLDSRATATATGPRATEAPVTTDALTARERAVLAELLAGHDNEFIAARLAISEDTVRTHLRNTLAKLGVGSRSEAVSWAYRSGVAPAVQTQEAVT